MRIGWFTPYYAVSAIGGYSAAVVEGLLARGHEVTVFAPNDSRFGGIRETTHHTVAIDSAYDPRIGAQLDRLDVIAYNFGNHFPFHGGIYEYAAKKPGIAILHDVVLRDFFWGWSAALTGSLEPLIALFRHWHGAEAAAYVGKRIADGLPLSVDDPTVLKWPLVAPVIANSLGAIAHSRFAQQRVSAETSREIIALDFPLFGPIVGRSQEEPPPKPPRDKQRILTFGVLNPNKRIDLTIQAFGASELLREHATFDVIGGGTPEYVQELQQKINALNLQDHIRLLGRQPDEVLVEKLFDADIVVNLRNPHMGESSASLVDSLLAGAPSVVWNHGSYQEFPDEFVCKISQDRELLPTLERLISDPANRQERAAIGRRHALERFNTENYCRNFEAIAERLISRRPAAELIDRVSSVLKEMRAVPTDACTLKIRDIMHCMTNDPPPHSRSGATPVPRSKAA